LKGKTAVTVGMGEGFFDQFFLRLCRHNTVAWHLPILGYVCVKAILTPHIAQPRCRLDEHI
jgi:hypothetical protein